MFNCSLCNKVHYKLLDDDNDVQITVLHNLNPSIETF